MKTDVATHETHATTVRAELRPPARRLRSGLRSAVEDALGTLRALPQETDPGSPLWSDWDATGPFAVRPGRGECAS